MKSLVEHINEWKLDKNSPLLSDKKYHPTSCAELKQLINNIYEYNKTYIDCNDIDVSNVPSFGDSYRGQYGLFSNMLYVNIIDISSWNMSHIHNMKHMFFDCRHLVEIRGIENINPKNIKDGYGMFYNCNDKVIPTWYNKRTNNIEI